MGFNKLAYERPFAPGRTLVLYTRMVIQNVWKFIYKTIGMESSFCSVQNMNVELLKSRSKYMSQLLCECERSNCTRRILSSYPDVPKTPDDVADADQQQKFEPNWFEPELFYSCVHWLANNGCLCLAAKDYSWQDVVHVANFLSSDYLFLIALRQIDATNWVEMFECFELYLRPSAWAWLALKIRMSVLFQSLTPKMILSHSHILQSFVGNKNVKTLSFLQEGMCRAIRMQFQNEYKYNSKKFITTMMNSTGNITIKVNAAHNREVTSSALNSAPEYYMNYMKKCILYYYGFFSNDVEYAHNRRSGICMASIRLSKQIELEQCLQCVSCQEHYVPTGPSLNLHLRLQTETVYTTCCFSPLHQACFQKLLGKPCLCDIEIPQFSTSELLIFLTSIRNRIAIYVDPKLPVDSYMDMTLVRHMDFVRCKMIELPVPNFL